MESPSISVVVSLYNKERYIERALVSIQNQTVSNYEVIIVDDGSTDNSAAVVKPWLDDERVRLIQQTNAGVGAARNHGVRESAGPVIAFLDADDRWLPEHLQHLLSLASQFPDANFFATGYRSAYRNKLTVLHTINRHSPCLIQNYYHLASSGHAIHISSTALRNYTATSGVQFNEHESIGEDEEFYARIAKRTPIAYDPRASSIYHCNTHGSAMVEAVWRSEVPLTARCLTLSLRETQLSQTISASAQTYLRRVLASHALTGIVQNRRREALTLLEFSKGLNASEKRKLRRLHWILRWAPKSISRVAIRLMRSRCGLLVKSLLAACVGYSGELQARSTIEWRLHRRERGD